MLLDFDQPATIDQLLFWMASLSPSVQDSLDRELYRQNADSDGSTAEIIMTDAFQLMMRDGASVGLQIEADWTEWMDRPEWIKDIIHLWSYLLPSGLYPQMRSNRRVGELVDHVLDGSGGHHETALQMMLSELGGLDGGVPLVPALTDVADQLYPVMVGSAIWSECLDRLQILLRDAQRGDGDPDIHDQVRRCVRGRLNRLQTIIEMWHDHPLIDDLQGWQDRVIWAWTHLESVAEWAYVWLTNSETLPTPLHDQWTLRKHWMMVSDPWYPDYFKVRKLNPSPAQQLFVRCVAATDAKSPQAYQTALDSFCVRYPDPVSDQRLQTWLTTQ